MEYLEPLVKIKYLISQRIYSSDIFIQITKIKNILIVIITITKNIQKIIMKETISILSKGFF
jgi:hypothetical protein